MTSSEPDTHAARPRTSVPFRPVAPIAIAGILYNRAHNLFTLPDRFTESFYAPLPKSIIEGKFSFTGVGEAYFTLSCPHGVPSSGGPFFVLHICGLDR